MKRSPAFRRQVFADFRAPTISAASKRPVKRSNAWKPPPPCRSTRAWISKTSIFLACKGSLQSKAQRYAFFAERKAAKIPGLADDTPILPIKKVGVIGAGLMGGGIATVFANAGFPVTVVEANRTRWRTGWRR